MKTLISILTLSFLMNCYSFKNTVTENNTPVTDQTKTYEIVLKDSERFIARNLVKNSETYHFTGSNGKEKSVSLDSVKTIRERTFSTGKTVGLSLGIIGAAAAVVLVAGANIDFNLSPY